MRLEPHILAILNASQASLDLLDMLPDADIVEELRYTLDAQFKILLTIIDNRHYGSDKLDEFNLHCDEIMKKAQLMDEQKERRNAP
jgi:hypothetical protein